MMKKIKITPYKVISAIVLIVLAFFFLFPLYWILTGSVKTASVINDAVPQWFPLSPTMDNYERLLDNPALLWLFNSVAMAVLSMVLTCVTASMAGYVLAKKRFVGRKVLFGIFICAMALPKQVILIPLLREMSFLNLHDSMWAVILPTVGWPFGVFLMKQFSENIPGELLEAAKIDGAGEVRTFTEIVLPIIKPGIGALAIFTFINCWNDYFLHVHRFRPDHGRCCSGGNPDHYGLPGIPEIFYKRNHYGSRKRMI